MFHLAGNCLFRFRIKGSWWPLFGTLLLTAFVGLAIGLLISALARSSEVAIRCCRSACCRW